MKIGKGINGGWYLVFNDEEEADKYSWILKKILRRHRKCYGGY